MIVSHESFRNLAAELNGCQIGLLLCDEGHRLKNSGKFKFCGMVFRKPIPRVEHVTSAD